MVTTRTLNKLKWTFENKGDIILADNVLTKDFLKEAGRTGFGMANRTLIMLEGASGGSKWRRTRPGARTIDMPISIFGTDRQQVEDRMRRFARLLQDDVTAPRLVATYPTSERVFTEVHYSGGADPQYGSDTDGEMWGRWAISLLAGSPYWTSEVPVQYNIAAANVGKGLIRTGNGGLSRLQLSSSQTIGVITVENPGDVSAFPVWTIRGPGDSFTATLPNGDRFKYKVPILSTDVITINTQDKTVTNAAGTNLYGNLDVAPKLFAVPSGNSTINVQMDGTTAASLISMYFNPRRELIF